MRKTIILLALASFMFACNKPPYPISGTKGSKGEIDYGSPKVKQELVNDQMFLIKTQAVDPTYGYSQTNPIMVGKAGGGPLDQRRFLNALAGPNGEEISYHRVGSCCHFYTKNGLFDNSGLLDIYEITYDGLEEPIRLYLNLYDSDELQVPVGFTLKK